MVLKLVICELLRAIILECSRKES